MDELDLGKVQVQGNGRFVIDDKVVVYNIEMAEDGITFSVDWDEALTSEADAMKLADSFLQKTLTGIAEMQK